jgi:single-strand DNA-binding protein
MNHLIIIGNLTADPESRSTKSGKRVVNFTVAANRRDKDNSVDYVRVSVWEKLGDVCAQYLSKGKKIMVSGPAHAGAYTNSKGEAVGTLELTAQDVEFLSPKDQETQYRTEERRAIQQEPQQAIMVKNAGGFVEVNDEDLPF